MLFLVTALGAKADVGIGSICHPGTLFDHSRSTTAMCIRGQGNRWFDVIVLPLVVTEA